ncbi:MAG: hypothetical protein JXR42_00500 [Gammaproteobacteria bacterium]|nr:hypothetical protein [Gammaproteobacteria bacterium]
MPGATDITGLAKELLDSESDHYDAKDIGFIGEGKPNKKPYEDGKKKSYAEEIAVDPQLFESSFSQKEKIEDNIIDIPGTVSADVEEAVDLASIDVDTRPTSESVAISDFDKQYKPLSYIIVDRLECEKKLSEMLIEFSKEHLTSDQREKVIQLISPLTWQWDVGSLDFLAQKVDDVLAASNKMKSWSVAYAKQYGDDFYSEHYGEIAESGAKNLRPISGALSSRASISDDMASDILQLFSEKPAAGAGDSPALAESVFEKKLAEITPIVWQKAELDLAYSVSLTAEMYLKPLVRQLDLEVSSRFSYDRSEDRHVDNVIQKLEDIKEGISQATSGSELGKLYWEYVNFSKDRLIDFVEHCKQFDEYSAILAQNQAGLREMIEIYGGEPDENTAKLLDIQFKRPFHFDAEKVYSIPGRFDAIDQAFSDKFRGLNAVMAYSKLEKIDEALAMEGQLAWLNAALVDSELEVLKETDPVIYAERKKAIEDSIASSSSRLTELLGEIGIDKLYPSDFLSHHEFSSAIAAISDSSLSVDVRFQAISYLYESFLYADNQRVWLQSNLKDLDDGLSNGDIPEDKVADCEHARDKVAKLLVRFESEYTRGSEQYFKLRSLINKDALEFLRSTLSALREQTEQSAGFLIPGSISTESFDGSNLPEFLGKKLFAIHHAQELMTEPDGCMRILEIEEMAAQYLADIKRWTAVLKDSEFDDIEREELDYLMDEAEECYEMIHSIKDNFAEREKSMRLERKTATTDLLEQIKLKASESNFQSRYEGAVAHAKRLIDYYTQTRDFTFTNSKEWLATSNIVRELIREAKDLQKLGDNLVKHGDIGQVDEIANFLDKLDMQYDELEGFEFVLSGQYKQYQYPDLLRQAVADFQDGKDIEYIYSLLTNPIAADLIAANPELHALFNSLSSRYIENYASQLHSICVNLVTQMDPEDFYNAKRVNKPGEEIVNPEAKRVADYFNGLKSKIEMDVVACEDIAQRTVVFEKWVLIANQLFQKGDYHSFLGVMSGLRGSTAARRLNATIAGLSSYAASCYRDLSVYIDDEHQTKLRDLYYADQKEGVIPYVGDCFTITTKTDDAVEGNTSERIAALKENGAMRRMVGLFESLRNISADTLLSEGEYALLDDLEHAPRKTDAELYKVSLLLEPRENTLTSAGIFQRGLDGITTVDLSKELPDIPNLNWESQIVIDLIKNSKLREIVLDRHVRLDTRAGAKSITAVNETIGQPVSKAGFANLVELIGLKLDADELDEVFEENQQIALREKITNPLLAKLLEDKGVVLIGAKAGIFSKRINIEDGIKAINDSMLEPVTFAAFKGLIANICGGKTILSDPEIHEILKTNIKIREALKSELASESLGADGQRQGIEKAKEFVRENPAKAAFLITGGVALAALTGGVGAIALGAGLAHAAGAALASAALGAVVGTEVASDDKSEAQEVSNRSTMFGGVSSVAAKAAAAATSQKDVAKDFDHDDAALKLGDDIDAAEMPSAVEADHHTPGLGS